MKQRGQYKEKEGCRKSRWQQLQEKGEAFSRKEIFLCYGGVFLISVLLGLGMQLKTGYFIMGIVLCLLQVPGLYFNYKKRMYEKKKFQHVNTYMSHLAQAFTGNGKILTSLKETREIFQEGLMRQILHKAVCHIEKSRDVELAGREALRMIEREYQCERVSMLHDFLQKAESRGGSCEREFRLLEDMRQLWEQTALKYQRTVLMARNLVTFEYFLLILVCMFMLKQFPAELEILHLPLIQGLNTFLIVCFFWLFSRLDKKASKSWLQDVARMSGHQAQQKFEYIRSFDGKKEMIRSLPYAVAFFVFFLIFFVWSKNIFCVVWGVVGAGTLLYQGQIRYFYTFQKIRREINRVFPEWLFDVLLLMQSENVPVALAKSKAKAPAVLRQEIEKLAQRIESNPMSAETFLLFLVEFRLPQVEEIMRKLYALNCGMGAGREVMNLIIDTNMNLLAETEKQKFRLKGDLYTIYYMLPTIPVMICMLGYGIALIFMIFRNIMTII